MKVYVDDMIVKSEKGSDHARDLEEALGVLDKFGMKLNLEKCIFGVEARKFLGFMISQRGIEATLEKIQAVMEMKPPRSIREMERLNESITALGRFIFFC